MTHPIQGLGTMAKGKRRQVARSKTLPEIITITSGKGGVGKTNIAVNLGILLRQRKQRVLIMDADLHLGKLDVILGITPRYTLAELIDGSRSMEEIILHHPSGIDILPATSGELTLL